MRFVTKPPRIGGFCVSEGIILVRREDCPSYSQCGFVQWRKDGANSGATPMPEDGDCGITMDECLRLNEAIPSVPLEKYGPQTSVEMEVSFPLIPNDDGRPEERIVGGGLR